MFSYHCPFKQSLDTHDMYCNQIGVLMNIIKNEFIIGSKPEMQRLKAEDEANKYDSYAEKQT